MSLNRACPQPHGPQPGSRCSNARLAASWWDWPLGPARALWAGLHSGANQTQACFPRLGGPGPCKWKQNLTVKLWNSLQITQREPRQKPVCSVHTLCEPTTCCWGTRSHSTLRAGPGFPALIWASGDSPLLPGCLRRTAGWERAAVEANPPSVDADIIPTIHPSGGERSSLCKGRRSAGSRDGTPWVFPDSVLPLRCTLFPEERLGCAQCLSSEEHDLKS